MIEMELDSDQPIGSFVMKIVEHPKCDVEKTKVHLGGTVQAMVDEIRRTTNSDRISKLEDELIADLKTLGHLGTDPKIGAFVEMQSCYEFGHAAVCWGEHEPESTASSDWQEHWLIVDTDGSVTVVV